MDLFSPRHLIVILAIVLLVFGTKKLKTIGSDLGSAVRGFKKSMSDAEAEPDTQANANTANTANAASAQQIRGPAAGGNADAEFPEVSARPTEPANSKPTPHA